ncbi:MAG: FtsX-like permease family protein, partial [Clostridia bacterium]|nr:FtsX-like permease family protein [Clostridia bacterium]
SKTSVQIMDLLTEIADDRLVIMVTHNPDLAEQYATRTVNLADGAITSDSDPYVPTAEEIAAANAKPVRRTRMSFLTALSLSANNLLTKKGRTILTAFAGSIGIIGIALILSLSAGVDMFIERIERDTLSSYPLEIDERTIDMTDMMTGMMDISSDSREHEDGKVYSGSRMTKLMSGWMSGVTENNLTAFKKYLDSRADEVNSLVSGIQYEYSTPLTLYRLTDDGKAIQVNPSTTLESTGMMSMMSMMSSGASGIQETMMNATMTRMNAFQPLLDNDELLKAQYQVLAGRMPEKLDEVVIIVNSRNELSDYALYTLGLKDQSELKGQFEALMNGEPIESEDMEFSYDELMALRFRLLLNTDYYSKEGAAWRNRQKNEDYMREVLENAMEIKVVGILKPADGAVATTVNVGVGYRFELMEYLLEQVKNSEIVQEQLANPEIDVFTGQAFETDQTDLFAALDSMSVSEFFEKYSGVMGMNAEIQKRVEQIPSFALNMVSKEDIKSVLRMALPEDMNNTLQKNLTTLGVSDVDSPSAIFLYPKNFESKAKLTEIIDAYNAAAEEKDVIRYTDYVGLLMSSITTIINAISYVLIAFVAISLVVSSIMIGIITYISVLERTKEIGILRAIGASKRDISRVFNAETLIVGFVAGFIGIAVTLLLVVLINVIIYSLTDIPNLANLPPVAGVILVVISMVLTFIAGLIPSRMAAKKDPVVALRTE